jgi:hypothetical protein
MNFELPEHDFRRAHGNAAKPAMRAARVDGSGTTVPSTRAAIGMASIRHVVP